MLDYIYICINVYIYGNYINVYILINAGYIYIYFLARFH
jgi:hypothetical protein